jgi:hypothetical protein
MFIQFHFTRRLQMKVQQYARMIVLVAVCIAGPQAFSQNLQRCSNHDFNGAFGFNLKGTNFGIGLYAIVGRMSSDGDGHFTGAGAQSVNGTIAQSTFTGTYVVNADCTGTAQLTFDTSGLQDTLSFVLVNDGDELLFLDIGGGTVETGSAKKQFHARPQGDVAAKQP